MSRKYILLTVVLVLILSTLACGLLPFGNDEGEEMQEDVATVTVEFAAQPEATGTEPVVEATVEAEMEESVDTDFPVTDDASNVLLVADTLNYQTSLSIDEVVVFYRKEFFARGMTERDILTVIDDSTLSIVFDTIEGETIVVQGVAMGDITNVNVRYEDV